MLLPETLALHDQSKIEFHYLYFLPWKDQMVSAIEINGGAVSNIKATNNLKIIFSYRKVIAYVEEHNIDVIHCHLPWAGFLGRLLHRLTKKPVLYTEHNKQERYHRLTFFVNKRSFNSQTCALAVSEDVRESIIKNINPNIEVRTLLNGVNTQKFQRSPELEGIREQLGIPKEAIVVGTVAVFRFQKRLLEWLQVMKSVIDQSDNFYGVIVGDGPLKAEIEEEYKRLGLEGRVFLVGLQTEVRPYMQAFDIYMMTSVFEGLPIALLEAMSMGCVIATTDAGGIKEVITSDNIGKMVGVESHKELEQVLLELEDTEVRKLLGQAARERVKSDFSLQIMVEKLEQLYFEYSQQRV